MANEIAVIERLEALYGFIENFPESPLAPIMKKEIEYLESL